MKYKTEEIYLERVTITVEAGDTIADLISELQDWDEGRLLVPVEIVANEPAE